MKSWMWMTTPEKEVANFEGISAAKVSTSSSWKRVDGSQYRSRIEARKYDNGKTSQPKEVVGSIVKKQWSFPASKLPTTSSNTNTTSNTDSNGSTGSSNTGGSSSSNRNSSSSSNNRSHRKDKSSGSSTGSSNRAGKPVPASTTASVVIDENNPIKPPSWSLPTPSESAEVKHSSDSTPIKGYGGLEVFQAMAIAKEINRQIIDTFSNYFIWRRQSGKPRTSQELSDGMSHFAPLRKLLHEKKDLLFYFNLATLLQRCRKANVDYRFFFNQEEILDFFPEEIEPFENKIAFNRRKQDVQYVRKLWNIASLSIAVYALCDLKDSHPLVRRIHRYSAMLLQQDMNEQVAAETALVASGSPSTIADNGRKRRNLIVLEKDLTGFLYGFFSCSWKTAEAKDFYTTLHQFLIQQYADQYNLPIEVIERGEFGLEVEAITVSMGLIALRTLPLPSPATTWFLRIFINSIPLMTTPIEATFLKNALYGLIPFFKLKTLGGEPMSSRVWKKVELGVEAVDDEMGEEQAEDNDEYEEEEDDVVATPKTELLNQDLIPEIKLALIYLSKLIEKNSNIFTELSPATLSTIINNLRDLPSTCVEVRVFLQQLNPALLNSIMQHKLFRMNKKQGGSGIPMQHIGVGDSTGGQPIASDPTFRKIGDVGAMFYGLKNMYTIHPEVRNLISILVRWIEIKPLAAKDNVGSSSMSTALLPWQIIQRPDELEDLSNAFFSLQAFDSEVPEVQQLLHAFTQSLAYYVERFPTLLAMKYIYVAKILHGLRRMSSDSEDVLLVFRLIRKFKIIKPSIEKVNDFHDFCKCFAMGMYGLNRKMIYKIIEQPETVHPSSLEGHLTRVDASSSFDTPLSMTKVHIHEEVEEILQMMYEWLQAIILQSKIFGGLERISTRYLMCAMGGLQDIRPQHSQVVTKMYSLFAMILEVKTLSFEGNAEHVSDLIKREITSESIGMSTMFEGLQSLSLDTEEAQRLVMAVSKYSRKVYTNFVPRNVLPIACSGLRSMSVFQRCVRSNVIDKRDEERVSRFVVENGNPALGLTRNMSLSFVGNAKDGSASLKGQFVPGMRPLVTWQGVFDRPFSSIDITNQLSPYLLHLLITLSKYFEYPARFKFEIPQILEALDGMQGLTNNLAPVNVMLQSFHEDLEYHLEKKSLSTTDANEELFKEKLFAKALYGLQNMRFFSHSPRRSSPDDIRLSYKMPAREDAYLFGEQEEETVGGSNVEQYEGEEVEVDGPLRAVLSSLTKYLRRYDGYFTSGKTLAMAMYGLQSMNAVQSSELQDLLMAIADKIPPIGSSNNTEFHLTSSQLGSVLWGLQSTRMFKNLDHSNNEAVRYFLSKLNPWVPLIPHMDSRTIANAMSGLQLLNLEDSEVNTLVQHLFRLLMAGDKYYQALDIAMILYAMRFWDPEILLKRGIFSFLLIKLKTQQPMASFDDVGTINMYVIGVLDLPKWIRDEFLKLLQQAASSQYQFHL